MKFNERLKALRKERGLTQTELADAAGVALMTVQRWEAGTNEPRVSDIQKLAGALGITTAALIGDPDVITVRHGGLTLDIPATPEAFAFLDEKIREFLAREVAEAVLKNRVENRGQCKWEETRK